MYSTQKFSARLERLQYHLIEFARTHSRFRRPKRPLYAALAGVLTGMCFVVIFQMAILPPGNFPVGVLVSIKDGTTVEEAAAILKDRDVIRSTFMFKALTVLTASDTGVLYGDYFFDIPESVWSVVLRVTHGSFGLSPIRVTIPEGATIYDTAIILSHHIPTVSEEEFLEHAEGKEGYLFPDTYLFLPNVSAEQVVSDMETVFNKKARPMIESLTEDTERSVHDIVTMAAILEKEAITFSDKRIVAGILWKRIDIDMPLQVDAPFAYERNKNTFQLTHSDLLEDSDYNTYTRTGLPIGPIANPGLESIMAALEPEESPYYFYLSDLQSNIHYGRDYAEHLYYKSLYLD
ncbi:MAG: endolytic transglycosylase MltG [Parcubacteria group bacterium]|nr:endolytic transglycosylase MltG [Parcubacteria group bacterium]